MKRKHDLEVELHRVDNSIFFSFVIAEMIGRPHA